MRAVIVNDEHYKYEVGEVNTVVWIRGTKHVVPNTELAHHYDISAERLGTITPNRIRLWVAKKTGQWVDKTPQRRRYTIDDLVARYGLGMG